MKNELVLLENEHKILENKLLFVVNLINFSKKMGFPKKFIDFLDKKRKNLLVDYMSLGALLENTIIED